MSWANIVSLFGAMVILASIPSLSVLTVSAKSASGGFIHGFFTTLGIVLGDIIFIIVALWGLSFLQDAMGSFFVLIKYIGAGYLIFLGISILRAKIKDPSLQKVDVKSLLSSFLTGLFITLGDQKATIFYLGFLPAFVDIGNISYVDTFIVIIIAMLAVGGVKLIYAFIANKSRLFFTKKIHKIINIFAGCLMIFIGVFLIVMP
ncbi:Lysine exporter protein (LYSE/YGGA) [Cyanobacterium stanieri PCC 7202]|uniref:Lysine exporter protein (LYSE/YGGA) n=1 Tax=Cyanobacterium stanieri (strain ATCC 29140 / PCC 7202) TaxID=292563 RepID=K9YLS5_CYASC|nr:Lysine exporter protein (LYSE/YGGA) [Cyanobacterium stanieri PCC 7202]